MKGLFGVPYEMNEETEGFFASPSIQAFINQSFSVIIDGGDKGAIGSSDIREIGGACSWWEVLDGVDEVQRGGPGVGACVLDAVGPGGDGREVEGQGLEDLGKAFARFVREQALGNGGDELVPCECVSLGKVVQDWIRSTTKRVEAEDRAHKDAEENQEARHPRSQIGRRSRDEWGAGVGGGLAMPDSLS